MVLIKIWSLKCKPETPWPFTLFKSPIPYFILRFIIISRHIKTSYNYKFMECVSDSPLHFLTNNIAIIYKKRYIFLFLWMIKSRSQVIFFKRKFFHLTTFWDITILPSLCRICGVTPRSARFLVRIPTVVFLVSHRCSEGVVVGTGIFPALTNSVAASNSSSRRVLPANCGPLTVHFIKMVIGIVQ